MAAAWVNKLSSLQPWVQPWVQFTLDCASYYYGFTPTVTSTYRSLEEQQRLYAARASNPYPVAPPGSSAHNYGLAWDSSVAADKLELWVAIRRAIGWVVPDNDLIHAEWPAWKQLVS